MNVKRSDRSALDGLLVGAVASVGSENDGGGALDGSDDDDG